MALVMLPSDLPWWDNVKKVLKKISASKDTKEIVNCMWQIYEMCNVSLDPDDDYIDPDQFEEFRQFMDNDMDQEERGNFFNKTLPNIVKRALQIKDLRPRCGIHFSLQQQNDTTEFDYNLAASLLANAFFSTFPKRTDKTHPTLQNFNFADFFKTLPNTNGQKAKLRSILHYFDWLETNEKNLIGSLKITRQVMHSKEWLTIEDWMECSLELCPLILKHEGKLERSDPENLQVCFCSAKLGGNVLNSGYTQESINLATAPELLILLLYVEALEDNEAIIVKNVRYISKINDPKHKATLEKLDYAKEVNICCIDADDYTKLPIGQYEEDNILRELNKCLLGFRQDKKSEKLSEEEISVNYNYNNNNNNNAQQMRQRRLSPIGESVGSSNQSNDGGANIPLITQKSCSTRADSITRISENSGNNNNSNFCRLQVHVQPASSVIPQKTKNFGENLINNRRGRFIVLGSSGEYLPVNRNAKKQEKNSSTTTTTSSSSSSSSSSSDSSSEELFHSAKTSLNDEDEDEEDANFHKRYSIDLETPERRQSFAQRLRKALKQEENAQKCSSTSSTDDEESSYAVGISVAGSGVADCDNIKVKRGGSTGFALREEDSLDEEFLKNSLNKEKQWISKFKTKQISNTNSSKKGSTKSSECSLSSDYSSELEEVYEQFTHWLENPILETDKGKKKELDGRDLAVVRFAGSLLKRTLSESFAGVPVPLTDQPCIIMDSTTNLINNSTKKNKLILSAKSLSLELAKQKHRLAAQLISAIASRKTSDKTGLKSIATGNWGCGASRKGDVQLKVAIQWMAASVAGIPALIYYTNKNQQLAKLDTVCRILIDRKWTVKDLAEATLRYSNQVLRGKELSGTLFEELIGG